MTTERIQGDDDAKGTTIGFCTTCMNRSWQLLSTLSVNLEALEGTPHFIALCNFNSTDGLDAAITSKYQQAMSSGKLVYFHTKTPQAFHASTAKNTAHRLAAMHKATFLFNLDADNYLDKKSVIAVEKIFSRTADAIIHQWTGSWSDGSFGRIGLSTKHWRKLGGYDEQFFPMSWQDMDLLFRARAINLRYRQEVSSALPAIRNSMSQKFANLSEIYDVSTPAAVATTFGSFNMQNLVISMGRPALLDESSQLRFSGMLNLATPCVV